MSIVVNGNLYTFRDPKELMLFLLRIVRVNHSSLDAMKKSMELILELFKEACIEARQNPNLKSSEKSSLTRMIRRTDRQITWWKSINTIAWFQFKYYDFILSLEGLKTLHGFSVDAPIEIGGKWSNPEKKSIYRRLNV